jgi:hypothetical protein
MPRLFHSTGITTCAHGIGGRKGRRAGLDPLEKKRFSYFARNRTPIPRLYGLSSGQYVLKTYWGIFTHTMSFPCRSPVALKANLHIPCWSHDVPLPRPYHDPATTLPRPCHSSTVLNAGRSPTCRLWTADAN